MLLYCSASNYFSAFTIHISSEFLLFFLCIKICSPPSRWLLHIYVWAWTFSCSSKIHLSAWCRAGAKCIREVYGDNHSPDIQCNWYSVTSSEIISALLPQFINVPQTAFFRIISVTVSWMYVATRGTSYLSLSVSLFLSDSPFAPFLYFTPGNQSLISLL